MEFEESGLQFEFDDDSCYRIELCPAAEAVGKGIKKAEFLCVQENNLWVLEAKSSIPNETKDKVRYEEWWQEIYEKLYNSLQLTALGLVGRHEALGNGVPDKLIFSDWSALKIQLVLVIPDAPKAYLPPLTDKLQKKFQTLFLKLWKIKPNEIMVLNRDLARRKALCQ
ncbi:hypothetical protein [Endozoicomonas numazuensis]|uniref:Uncharacterized protein n=1 Tax=Endozoicomonas numazuensis TaxID=1137799 RepID=A0A081NMQ3_9GAMM|nr:hypothetical protein [Endozoicomonas numazuensis]KEQ19726.1 hypothetical protein GZ78_07595 [Endozoicomonas numazuensis]